MVVEVRRLVGGLFLSGASERPVRGRVLPQGLPPRDLAVGDRSDTPLVLLVRFRFASDPSANHRAVCGVADVPMLREPAGASLSAVRSGGATGVGLEPLAIDTHRCLHMIL